MPHRNLVVGWFGLLAIAVAVVTQFEEISQLASLVLGPTSTSSMVRPETGSLVAALFVSIFPHALSAVAIVAAIGMVMIQGPARWKIPMTLSMVVVLVVFEYHWPANWSTPGEWRVIASLFFIFSMTAITISAVALLARATCQWTLTTGERLQTRSISLSELIVLTAAAACTLALGRQSEFTATELLEWCLGTIAYVFVLSARLLSLADDSPIRRWGRGLGILSYGVLQLAEELWPFDQLSSLSWGAMFASLPMAMVGAIVYWFLTMVPILWMQANDWRVVSASSLHLPETDVVHTSA